MREVALAMLRRHGRWLLQLRDDTEGIVAPGHWGLFGGHLDPGETPEEALRRELEEEIGWQAQNLTPWFVETTAARRAHFFRGDLDIAVDQLVLMEGQDLVLADLDALNTGQVWSPRLAEYRPLAASLRSAVEALNHDDPVRLTDLSHGGGCGCKMAPGILQEILRSMPQMPLADALLVDLSTADDAAVYQLNGEQALVATTDFFMPIVDDAHDFGRIAATNAISDVYAMGAQPILALALVGMPLKQLGTEVISRILSGGHAACRAAGIPIAGGHTIESQEPIYGLVVLGLVHPKQVRRNSDAQPGDRLVLGKGLGVGVLAAALRRGQLNAEGYDALLESTTTLNAAGPALAGLSGVHALTDITGFGLVGHGLEVARGSNVSLRLDWSAVPMLPQARQLAEAGLVTGASERNWSACADAVSLPNGLPLAERALFSDPQTSGGLLVSCDPSCVSDVIHILQRFGSKQAAEIGEVQSRDSEALLVVEA